MKKDLVGMLFAVGYSGGMLLTLVAASAADKHATVAEVLLWPWTWVKPYITGRGGP